MMSICRKKYNNAACKLYTAREFISLYWLLIFTSFNTPNGVHINEVLVKVNLHQVLVHVNLHQVLVHVNLHQVLVHTRNLIKLHNNPKVYFRHRSHLGSEMELYGPLQYRNTTSEFRKVRKNKILYFFHPKLVIANLTNYNIQELSIIKI